MLLIGTVLAASLVACGDEQRQQQVSADCGNLVRLNGTVYEEIGTVRVPATRAGMADASNCADVGPPPPRGAYFPEQPRQVQTWSIAGFPMSRVVGVRQHREGTSIYVAQRVSQPNAERIFAELARGHLSN